MEHSMEGAVTKRTTGPAPPSVRSDKDGVCGNQEGRVARIIHECRRESFKIEANRGFSQVSDGDVPTVRREGRMRNATSGQRVGRCSRYL